LALTGLTYGGVTESSDTYTGCIWSLLSNAVWFTSNTNVANTSGASKGGICRIGGSPSVYQKAGGLPCSSDDIINTAADCEVAMNEIALVGYEWGGSVSEDDNTIPGCYWNTV
jgi:hypothetical protein